MQPIKKIILFAFLALLVGGCSQKSTADDKKLMVSAASSLTEVMEELETEFHKANPDIDILFNYGSSSKLRNQIQNGAPADIFLSASEEDMKILTDNGQILQRSIASFARNKLILAMGSEGADEADVEQVLSNIDSTLAVADPESVPLGDYTRRSLQELKIWQGLEGNMIYAKDARQVLTYLESGNAEAGIIYSSDAKLSSKIKGTIEIPLNIEEIVYPGGIIATSAHQETAEEFMSFLQSDEGQQIIEQFGFVPVNGDQP